MRFRLKTVAKAASAAAAALALGHGAWAGEAEAKKWIDAEFQPSTLNKDQQMVEMKWFIEAAKKLQAKGVKEISVVSETLTTHEYESKTLAKAFEEITGIKVKHDIIQEGDVVEKLQTSMQSGKSIYDGWISDSDLIGTHYRYGTALALSDQMAGAWKEFTNPGLDLKDFIGTSFTTAPDKKLYQLPVISSKALASVFDSYSCVVNVSDTTEICVTPLACSFLAAAMNHFISVICWSLFSVDGWNSASIHFLASASPAHAPCPNAKAAAAALAAFATVFKRNLMSVS